MWGSDTAVPAAGQPRPVPEHCASGHEHRGQVLVSMWNLQHVGGVSPLAAARVAPCQGTLQAPLASQTLAFVSGGLLPHRPSRLPSGPLGRAEAGFCVMLAPST